jgi:hypothetical protein
MAAFSQAQQMPTTVWLELGKGRDIMLIFPGIRYAEYSMTFSCGWLKICKRIQGLRATITQTYIKKIDSGTMVLQVLT